jgi:hypothetical protein
MRSERRVALIDVALTPLPLRQRRPIGKPRATFMADFTGRPIVAAATCGGSSLGRKSAC